MLICRSQGHLAVSQMDNKSKNCIGTGQGPFPFVFNLSSFPSRQVSLVDWDGKSRAYFDMCKSLLKIFSQPFLATQNPPPLPRRFKERLSESGCKCKRSF